MTATDAVAEAIRAATIDPDDRGVVIAGSKYSADQARRLAQSIVALADAAEAAVAHTAGDTFIAPRVGTAFVSDGVVLWSATRTPQPHSAAELASQFGGLTLCAGIGAAVRAGLS